MIPSIIQLKCLPFKLVKKQKKEVYSNLKDNREVRKPKIKLGQLFRTADIKILFIESERTNWSYILFTKTEVIHDTIPSYRFTYLREGYN